MTQVTENFLDVTVLEPRQKHPTIFRMFDELNGGESLTIHNDHDPKPLYYQLLGERGDCFTWEYLESGPEIWEVKISKKVAGQTADTIGKIAAKDMRKAQVFKKYGIDFCCGGKKTLMDACAEKGLDIVAVEKELQDTEKYGRSRELPFDEWNAGFLVDYIVNTHHTYVRKNLPDIMQFSRKVVQVHGDRHAELSEIAAYIEKVEQELVVHMQKEEQILFPFIKQLAGASKGQAPGFSVQNPIRVMENEHEAVGQYMAEIRKLTNDFKAPAGACTTFNLLYNLLADFEDDLHLHIHLENNILFPKAQELERALLS